LSKNNGTSWNPIDSGLAARFVLSLAVIDTYLFAGTNSSIGAVSLLTNNGTCWTTVSSGLPTSSARSFAINGSNLFVGIQNGVYLSTNYGTSWTAVNDGLTNTNVASLAVKGNYIFAGTDSGVYRRPLSEMVGVINPQSQSLSHKSTTFTLSAPSQTQHNLAVDFSLPSSSPVNISIFNLSGHQVASLVNKNLGSGSYTYLLDTKNLAAGYYSVRMQAGTNTYVKNVPIVR
jgi:hypothetical protein